MLHVPIDCPHCATKKAPVNVHAAYASTKTHIAAFGSCNICFGAVVIYGRTGEVSEVYARKMISDVMKDWATIIENMIDIKIAPSSPKPRNIAHLPTQVENAFREAEAAYTHKLIPSAAMGYRRAIERTLKLEAPEGKGMLNARIRQLEKSQGLPQSLIDLMDTVKFLGNDAAHELDDPEPEDVDLGRDLTALFLTYIYELPGRLQIVSEKRKAMKVAK